MCGIFATTRAEQWRPHMPSILKDLAHRGPDAHGIWEDPDSDVALCHTRLAVLGLGEEGAQPACFRGNQFILTYNGEIYNFQELSAAAGFPKSASDTRFVGEALASSGFNGLSQARGMFAYAAWDRVNKRMSWGRDRWGIKPLYILHHAGGGVTVCSEIRPLLRLEESRVIDPVGLAQYIAFGHTGPVQTVYQRIRKCAPGVSWEVSTGLPGPAGFRSMKLPPSSTVELDIPDAIVNSVTAHMVADVELGVFLSGGTDSTLLAAIASTLAPGIRTFTIAFPGHPEIDESSLAEANSRAMGTTHRTIPVTTSMMLENAETFVRIQGEPFGDPAALPLLSLAQAASEDVKVVLGGEGADELFGGYGRYRVSQLCSRVPFKLLAAMPGLAQGWARLRGDKPRSRAIEAVLLGGGVLGHAALLGSELPLLERTLPDLMGDVANLTRTTWASLDDAGDEPTRARRFDTVTLLPDGYLEKTDRATMASGLEARVPYLDPVVASAASRSAPGKAQLAATLACRLPSVVAPPRKKGLAVHLPDLLTQGLGAYSEYELCSEASIIRRLFGSEGTAALAGRCKRSTVTMYRLAILGLWESTLSFPTKW